MGIHPSTHVGIDREVEGFDQKFSHTGSGACTLEQLEITFLRKTHRVTGKDHASICQCVHKKLDFGKKPFHLKFGKTSENHTQNCF